MQKYLIPGIVVIAVFLVTIYASFNDKTYNNPSDTLPDTQVEPLTSEEKANIEIEMSEKEVLITDGVKHTVPLQEIVGGGPEKDGIPSIDKPIFTTTKEAEDFLSDIEPGIAYSSGDTNRFYPFKILVWHEIVNDHVDGKRILVTYCPLCLTATVFDPIVDGDRVEFGTSGKLWQSNLVMYDRKTDTYWSQVLGEAIKGELAGSKLPILSSDMARFGDWKKQFPKGEVLSMETGALKFYGSNPYGDYYDVQDFSLYMINGSIDGLEKDAFVFGIEVDGQFKAYNIDSVKEVGQVVDTFNGTTFTLTHDLDLDVVRIYKQLPDGAQERVNPISGFWFSWAAAHPDTQLYK